MKKITSLILTSAIMLALSVPQAFAAESWREAFITRLMKVMSSDPTYSEVVLTDLDHNGVPEAFVFRNSADGGISTGFTMNGNSIATIDVPNNIIGACLNDLTVYNDDGRYIFVGREIPRYSNEIHLYKLELMGNQLVATKIKKEYVSEYTTIPYKDMYGNNFLTSGYPNRSKISDFINQYDSVNNLTASKSQARVLVNGKSVEIPGYTVNDSNYFKIRDIAMIVRTTASKFNVDWDEELSAIAVTTGEKYVIVGGELSEDTSPTLDILENTAPIYVDGNEAEITAYNINGSNYFKVRDLGDLVGFDVDWDGDEQAIILRTDG